MSDTSYVLTILEITYEGAAHILLILALIKAVSNNEWWSECLGQPEVVPLPMSILNTPIS
jgi:hypothetical protein